MMSTTSSSSSSNSSTLSLGSISSCSSDGVRYHYLPERLEARLLRVIRELMDPCRIMYAADESHSTLGMQLKKNDIEDTHENRTVFRAILYGMKNLHNYISGISMCYGNIDLEIDDGLTFRENFQNKGIIIGMRVDTGLSPTLGPYKEFITLGNDYLDHRCTRFKAMNVKYCTWTTVVTAGKKVPSLLALKQNSADAAYFATTCQKFNLVPVVQVKIWPAGKHDVACSQNALVLMLGALFKALHKCRVCLEAMILTTSFVCSGDDSGHKWDNKEVATATAAAICQAVPCELPVIAFSSGGKHEDVLCRILQIMHGKIGAKPWRFSLNCCRTLQSAAMSAWSLDDKNYFEAEVAFENTLAKCCYAVSVGIFCPETLTPEEPEDDVSSAEEEVNEDLDEMFRSIQEMITRYIETAEKMEFGDKNF